MRRAICYPAPPRPFAPYATLTTCGCWCPATVRMSQSSSAPAPMPWLATCPPDARAPCTSATTSVTPSSATGGTISCGSAVLGQVSAAAAPPKQYWKQHSSFQRWQHAIQACNLLCALQQLNTLHASLVLESCGGNGGGCGAAVRAWGNMVLTVLRKK